MPYPFWPPTNLYTLPSRTFFKCPTFWEWSTSLAAFENYRRSNESGCIYVRNTHVIGLCCCDERTCINGCVNKSLFQALKNSAVVLLVMSPACYSANHWTFSCRNSKSAGLANAVPHGQPKIGCNYCEPGSYYDSASVPKWPQKQSRSEHLISWGNMPPDPLVLHAYVCIATYS